MSHWNNDKLLEEQERLKHIIEQIEQLRNSQAFMYIYISGKVFLIFISNHPSKQAQDGEQNHLQCCTPLQSCHQQAAFLHKLACTKRCPMRKGYWYWLKKGNINQNATCYWLDPDCVWLDQIFFYSVCVCAFVILDLDIDCVCVYCYTCYPLDVDERSKINNYLNRTIRWKLCKDEL